MRDNSTTTARQNPRQQRDKSTTKARQKRDKKREAKNNPEIVLF